MGLSKLFTSVYILSTIMMFMLKLASGAVEIDPTIKIYTICNFTQNYTAGSLFDRTMNDTLSSFQSSASFTTYVKSYTTQPNATGNITDVFYANYQCRGDMPLSNCSQCVTSAVGDVRASCPNAIGGRVQLEGCFLRYYQHPYYTESNSLVTLLCNTQKENDTTFLDDVQMVVDDVTSAAPTKPSMYANATRQTVNGYTLYGLAQCQGYLSTSECESCLSAYTRSWDTCGSAVGAQVHATSCYYRYEIYPFFYTS